MGQQIVLTGSGPQPVRHPNVFNSGVGAGTTITVWTPTSGKKFRLLRYQIEVTADAAAASANQLSITLQDNSTSLGLIHSVFIPSAAGTAFGAGYNSGWVDLGGVGLLSAAANNALKLSLSFALTSGKVRCRVAGTEE